MKNLLRAMLIIFASVGAHAAHYKGDVYEQKSNKQKKLYTFEFNSTEVQTSEGLMEKGEALFKNPDGAVVFQEVSDLKGNDLVKTEIDQKQIGQKARIEVKDGMVYFSKTVDGKEKIEKEKLGKTFVTSANFQKYVRSQWTALLEGKNIEFRYGVWDRQETVGFEIFKDKEEELNGKKVLVLKMKPSSFVIAALVKPLFFKFDMESQKLLELSGRVPPKQKVGDAWKDLDAEVVYSY